MINCMHQTGPREAHHTVALLHHTRRLQSLSCCWSLCQKSELCLVEPGWSQWTVRLRYLIIWTKSVHVCQNHSKDKGVILFETKYITTTTTATTTGIGTFSCCLTSLIFWSYNKLGQCPKSESLKILQARCRRPPHHRTKASRHWNAEIHKWSNSECRFCSSQSQDAEKVYLKTIHINVNYWYSNITIMTYNIPDQRSPCWGHSTVLKFGKWSCRNGLPGGVHLKQVTILRFKQYVSLHLC